MTTSPGPGTTGSSGTLSGTELLQFAKQTNMLNPNMTVGELLDHAATLQSQASKDLPHILGMPGYVFITPNISQPS